MAIRWYPASAYYRPSLWITLRRFQMVIFFGWQQPSVVVLR